MILTAVTDIVPAPPVSLCKLLTHATLTNASGKLTRSTLNTSGCVYSGFLLNQWNATLLGQAQNQSAAWQALQPIPILIQGWLVLWSSLQALLLATDHHENPLLSPRWANGLFVGLGSVLILAITAIAIPVVLQGQRLWSDFTSIQSRLTTLEAAWTPSDNVLPQLFELKPKLDALMVKGEFFRKLSISQIAVIAIMPFVFSTVSMRYQRGFAVCEFC